MWPGHQWTKFASEAPPGTWPKTLRMPEPQEQTACKFSLLCSFGRLGRLLRFDQGHGAVFVAESFVGHTPHIRFAYTFNAFNLVEEFAPVAITRLGLSKLQGQAFIVCEPANKVGFSAGL